MCQVICQEPALSFCLVQDGRTEETVRCPVRGAERVISRLGLAELFATYENVDSANDPNLHHLRTAPVLMRLNQFVRLQLDHPDEISSKTIADAFTRQFSRQAEPCAVPLTSQSMTYSTGATQLNAISFSKTKG